MKKIRINTSSNFKDFGSQKVLTLNLTEISSKEVCLLLMLLREGLNDLVEIELDDYRLQLTHNIKNQIICTSLDLQKRIFKGKLSTNGAEAIICFLLKFYRDGFGESEHLDIDFEWQRDNTVTLTFKLDHYKEYSPDEIDKILNT